MFNRLKEFIKEILVNLFDLHHDYSEQYAMIDAMQDEILRLRDIVQNQTSEILELQEVTSNQKEFIDAMLKKNKKPIAKKKVSKKK